MPKKKKKLNSICGVKDFDNPNPSDIKPKVHAEKEEMAEDE